MRKLFGVLFAWTVCACSMAQEPAIPEWGAHAAVDRFIFAWNAASNDLLQETIHAPMMTLVGDRLLVAQEAKDFTVDFEGMKANEGWAQSTADEVTVLGKSGEQVHCIVDYSRVNAEGETYRRGRVFYVIVYKDERWGIQLRAPLGEPTGTDAAVAQGVIDQFFTHWNGANNQALHGVIHFPHAFIIRGGSVRVSSGPSELMTDFDGMREREGWHESRYSELRVAHADEQLILAYLTFTRHKADGSEYTRVPVLWMLTKGEDDAWAIQVRAIMNDI